MTAFFTLPARPTLAVAGHDARFPVGRVFCVGRNYADHAREMGADPEREPPFFFTKFADTVVPGGGDIAYPPMTGDYHYEGELVVAIGRTIADGDLRAAYGAIFGYAAGLDMTRRDLQMDARKSGRPWDMGKNFALSAPVSAIHRSEEVGHLSDGVLRLTVNGAERQRTDLSLMIWSSAEIVVHLSRYETLQPGDLVFTGTPAGVGSVKPGDKVEVTIEGLTPLSVAIVEPASRG